MEQNFKPITKQLTIAAFILASVTVLSFGIRQVRLNACRVDSDESTPSARPSDPEDQSQTKQPLNADAEADYYLADSYTDNAESDTQYAEASDWDEELPSDDYSEENIDSVKLGKAVSLKKLFKDDYAKAKAKGLKGLEKISLGDNENLYLTEKGEYWYVSKGPGGDITKMQVQIDDDTGELTAVDGGYYANSGDSLEPHRIPMSDNEDIYLTEKGEAWYVSEQPDGETVKVQLQPD